MKLRLAHDDLAIYEGEALDVLRALPSDSVDAVVTSPPYADLRAYGGAAPEQYVEWISPVLSELRRVVKPKGGFMLNLGRVFRNGEESTYHVETMLHARSLGWLLVDTIVWHKTNAHPFSAPQYLHNKHEYVYWFGRQRDAYRGYTAETRRPHSSETVARRKRGKLRGPRSHFGHDYVPADRKSPLDVRGAKPASVVSYSVGKVKGLRHTAPMSYDLAAHLVALACPVGGVVLDPFFGSGTTGLAAVNTGRRCIGVDVDAQACAEAVERAASQVTLPVMALQGTPEGGGGVESLAVTAIPASAPFSRGSESSPIFSEGDAA